MPTILKNARIFTPIEIIEQGTVVISDDGLIAYVGPTEDGPQASSPPYNIRGRIVAPGFVDIHVHGGHGITFGNLNKLVQELRAYSRWVASHGVTGFLCTLTSPDQDSLLRMVAGYTKLLDAGGLPGAVPLGLHLEGPYLSKERAGAFNPMWLRDPSLEETTALLEAGSGWIRQMTLAPELPLALEVAALLRQAGVIPALGHTDADCDTTRTALNGDFKHVTHTFSAMRRFHHREPGALGAILVADEVTAELIADGVHAHPGAMEVLVRCLGTDRVVLVSDAMAGAGMGDGQFDLVGQAVMVKNGRAITLGGTIAGSTATLNGCMRNMHLKVGLPLLEVVRMASLNPARAMGLEANVGSIGVGREANLVIMDENINVQATLIRGQVVYGSL